MKTRYACIIMLFCLYQTQWIDSVRAQENASLPKETRSQMGYATPENEARFEAGRSVSHKWPDHFPSIRYSIQTERNTGMDDFFTIKLIFLTKDNEDYTTACLNIEGSLQENSFQAFKSISVIKDDAQIEVAASHMIFSCTKDVIDKGGSPQLVGFLWSCFPPVFPTGSGHTMMNPYYHDGFNHLDRVHAFNGGDAKDFENHTADVVYHLETFNPILGASVLDMKSVVEFHGPEGMMSKAVTELRFESEALPEPETYTVTTTLAEAADETSPEAPETPDEQEPQQ